jgi:hypothetical protein
VAALTSNVSQILKTVYDTSVHDLVNSDATLFGRVRKEYGADGVEFKLAHRVGGTGSMGYQSEGATLPTADRQRYLNSTVRPMEWWGTLKLSQKLISLSKTNKGAFMRGLSSEIEGFAKSARRQEEILFMGDGTSHLSTAGVTSDESEDTITLATANFADARKFTIGQECEFWTTGVQGAAADTVTNAGGGIVTAINLATGVITFADLAGVADGTVWVSIAGGRIAGTVDAANERLTCMGLDFIDDKDTPMENGTGFQGIKAPLDAEDAANTGSNISELWASKVLSNGGTNRAITERLLQQGEDAVEIRSNGRVNVWVSPYGPRLEYAVGQQNVRRSVNTPKISGSTTGGFDEDVARGRFIEYGGNIIIPNRFCRVNTMYGLTWSDIKLKYWAKMQWWDGDGSIVRRAPLRTTHYEAEQFCFKDLCVGERAAHVRIEDVDGTDPA